MPPGDYDDDIRTALGSEDAQNAKAKRKYKDKFQSRSIAEALREYIQSPEQYKATETNNQNALEQYRRTKAQTGEY